MKNYKRKQEIVQCDLGLVTQRRSEYLTHNEEVGGSSPS